MALKIQLDQKNIKELQSAHSKNKDQLFSKDYVDFLNDEGWRLERKFPSNSNKYYSDLLEDTDWKTNSMGIHSSKHYRRDLDALS